jgi:hypothetical protein
MVCTFVHCGGEIWIHVPSGFSIPFFSGHYICHIPRSAIHFQVKRLLATRKDGLRRSKGQKHLSKKSKISSIDKSFHSDATVSQIKSHASKATTHNPMNTAALDF